jgi:uncharacterized protein YlxW (UPF0749 family)
LTESERETIRTISSLETTVRHLTDTWKRQDSEATEGRRRLHEKVDELKSQQATLAATVKQQTTELAELKPAIKRFEADRQRREGANSLIKLMWAGLIAFAGGLGYVGHELAVYLWPPKH